MDIIQIANLALRLCDSYNKEFDAHYNARDFVKEAVELVLLTEKEIREQKTKQHENN